MNSKIKDLKPSTANNAKWPHSFEQPISYAPLVQLSNGNWVVPQHFLRYKHTLQSVNDVLSQISFSAHFRVIAAEKDQQVYLQVAILNPDNYQSSELNQNAKKLLFGRRWYVEENLPTSELIQTAYLALKVAREHEVRELIKFKHQNGSSTPFNNHHDLPLMAQNAELVMSDGKDISDVNEVIDNCIFAGAPIKLINVNKIDNSTVLYQVQLTCHDCQLHEFNNTQVSFLVNNTSTNLFLHGLIDALIKISNEFVSENFKYNDLARFSKHISVEKIGELSIKLRSHNALNLCSLGKQHANQLNFEIDSGRAPQGCNSEISGFLAAHGVERPQNAHLYTNQFTD
ncbi:MULTISPECIES: hypothetical protein [unclassified Pseudoalteromonas]|uniref:hypothetical protein n=1 Tax=unclassified Pseudoalteromonas TaxID=194690 RepID=UPI000C07C22B|nr:MULTISPECIES: hypothetical protein [unclassified Pseudoalteromonas]MDP2636580.1 hypothetical protein [Pseudoalteromonas sp. 1_MG-2023]PHN89738.1 hypothetical protein CSC79_10730 [Pseudoalteromonas sp. 3D05]